MADSLTDILKELGEGGVANEVMGVFSRLIEKKNELDEVLSKAPKGSTQYKQTLSELSEVEKKINDLKNTIPLARSTLSEAFGEMNSGLGSFGKAIGVSMDTISKSVMSGFNSLLGSGALLGAVFTDAGRAMLNPIQESTELVSSIFGRTIGQANNALKTLLETQNVARTAFIAAGKDIDVANVAASEYVQSLRRMSIATGLSGKDIHSLSKELIMLGTEAISVATPGLSEFTDKLIGKGVTAPVIATTAFRGLGFSIVESTQFIKKGFTAFGESAMETAKTVGIFAEAAEQTGYSTLNVVEPIRRASEALAIFGRGSTAAASMWTTFTKALLDDVPLEQTNQMVQQLTSSLAGMKVEERAFISMISGMAQGATALGGGLKMELAMRTEGGLQKNFEALTESIRRFGGGQIITLEQAANNPQLEMQFQVQRQMLGRLANITDQQQQNRMLEVMQKVEQGGMSQVEGSEKMKEVFDNGLSIQQKEVTFLENIAKNTALIAGIADKPLSAIDEAFKNTPKELLNYIGQTAGVRPGMEMGSEAGLRAVEFVGSRLAEGGFEQIKGMSSKTGEDIKESVSGVLMQGKTLFNSIRGKNLPENFKTEETSVTELPNFRGGSSIALNTSPSLANIARRAENLPEAGRLGRGVEYTIKLQTDINLNANDESLRGLLAEMKSDQERFNRQNETKYKNMLLKANSGRPIE